MKGEIPAFFLQFPTILSIRLWFFRPQAFAFPAEKRKTAAQDVPPQREKIPAGSVQSAPGGEKFRQNAPPPPDIPAAVQMCRKWQVSWFPPRGLPRPRSGSPAVWARGQRRAQKRRLFLQSLQFILYTKKKNLSIGKNNPIKPKEPAFVRHVL